MHSCLEYRALQKTLVESVDNRRLVSFEVQLFLARDRQDLYVLTSKKPTLTRKLPGQIQRPRLPSPVRNPPGWCTTTLFYALLYLRPTKTCFDRANECI